MSLDATQINQRQLIVAFLTALTCAAGGTCCMRLSMFIGCTNLQ